jgi:hypothetical protein
MVRGMTVELPLWSFYTLLCLYTVHQQYGSNHIVYVLHAHNITSKKLTYKQTIQNIFSLASI